MYCGVVHTGNVSYSLAVHVPGPEKVENGYKEIGVPIDEYLHGKYNRIWADSITCTCYHAVTMRYANLYLLLQSRPSLRGHAHSLG